MVSCASTQCGLITKTKKTTLGSLCVTYSDPKLFDIIDVVDYRSLQDCISVWKVSSTHMVGYMSFYTNTLVY